MGGLIRVGERVLAWHGMAGWLEAGGWFWELLPSTGERPPDSWMETAGALVEQEPVSRDQPAQPSPAQQFASHPSHHTPHAHPPARRLSVDLLVMAVSRNHLRQRRAGCRAARGVPLA